jgi:hypothetical protein
MARCELAPNIALPGAEGVISTPNYGVNGKISSLTRQHSHAKGANQCELTHDHPNVRCSVGSYKGDADYESLVVLRKTYGAPPGRLK